MAPTDQRRQRFRFSNAPNSGDASISSQQTPPTPSNSLIATLKGSFHPQDTSPLFIVLPPEIRNRIFALALSSYDDKSRPYPSTAYCYRPGYHYRQRTDTALLATCHRIYSETHDLPVSLNEHVFWCSAERGPIGLKFCDHPDNYFKQMTTDQRKAVKDVHLFTQLFWLENSFPRICTTLNTKRIKITVRHTDWWWWESNCPLTMQPGWGNKLKEVKGLQELVVELEVMERDTKQLETIVKTMRTWKLDLDEGRKLAAHANPVTRERYIGQGSFQHFGRHQQAISYVPATNSWSEMRGTSIVPVNPVPYVVFTLRWTL